MIDTLRWIRNRSDEIAAENGCKFDVARGAWTVWWIERFCYLYEGEQAGENVILRSGHEHLLPFSLPILDDWDCGGQEKSIERARLYAEYHQQGGQVDWQYECTMRLFGWSKHSDFYGRDVRRFRRGIVFISKKNKKTPTLAAWGVYLTCGDGEQGAKSFAVAKDGGQAMLAMDHAIKMVQQSPELSLECKINQHEKSITHLPTNSVYKPLATNNSSSAASQEGRNGNLLVDEIHVVDRDAMGRLERATISRSEGLRIEVSTAGNDPDGYGKETQDYARQVLEAAEKNEQLFAAIYEAPQTLTDAELESDPIKFGKMANPAWGHTINPQEYMADYVQSKRSIGELAKFKMYRLNIWQHSANQWLRLDKWLDCGEAISLSSFEGQPCSAGLDLSKTKDMSALALCINKTLFVRLWMTQSYAEKNKDKAKFLEWADGGSLVLIPGETIQESFIRAEFERLTKLLRIQVLVKDRTFCQDFAEWVEDKWPNLLQIEYPQNAKMMEKPIDDFEAAVIDGELRHENNPCLNWQASHATVAENADGYRIIKKPKRHDVRKVDGMVASVMAFWGCKHLPKRDSVYRRRGVLTA